MVPESPPAASSPASSQSGVPSIPVQDAGLATLTTQERQPPTELRYERLGIAVPVDAVGVADGQMEIPPDASRAGWYRFGPGLEANSGDIVIAAHAGSSITPRGPFYDLREADPGDEVTVTSSDGEDVRFEVVTVEQEAKTTLDMTDYFGRGGQPRLVLITCGGRWDEARDSYDDNIIVTAVPVAH